MLLLFFPPTTAYLLIYCYPCSISRARLKIHVRFPLKTCPKMCSHAFATHSWPSCYTVKAHENPPVLPRRHDALLEHWQKSGLLSTENIDAWSAQRLRKGKGTATGCSSCQRQLSNWIEQGVNIIFVCLHVCFVFTCLSLVLSRNFVRMLKDKRNVSYACFLGGHVVRKNYPCR